MKSPAEETMSARKGKPTILMIGALPPPAIGPFLAMQRLVGSQVLNDAFTLSFLDLSDRRPPASIGRFDGVNLVLGIKHALQCLGRLLFDRPRIVYLAVAQGTWGYLRDLAFIVPALCLRKQLVIHLRGSEFRAFYEQMPAVLRWVTRVVLARTARVIVLGERLRPLFDGLIDPDRVVVIPNGIDYEAYTRPAAVGPVPPGRRLLYLASLRRRKGPFLLLEALPKVLEQYPDVRLTMAGQWRSEAEKMEADRFISRLGLAEKVRFTGEVSGSEKTSLFHEHDLFVFTPLEPEGLPWVILEAMSASLPVVSTDQGAIAEVVEHGKTGLLVEPTAESVAGGICSMLSSPPNARDMGMRGRRRVESCFSEPVYIARLVALFRDVAEGSTRAA